MNKFRSSINSRLLKALFYETVNADKSTVIYTLKDEDHEGFPSLYRLYMETSDSTEYDFAVRYLDGWEHWEMLCKCNWFKPYVSRWRRELEVKLRSQALKAIKDVADTREHKDSLSANRFLLEKGWVKKQEKGRPKQEDIEKAAILLAEDENKIKDDFARILGNG